MFYGIKIVGVPDDRLGEEVCAWVRPKSGAELIADELKQFCKERVIYLVIDLATCSLIMSPSFVLHRQLAYFKVPRYWMFKETFPLTVTGKVQKFAMRQASIEELRLANASS